MDFMISSCSCIAHASANLNKKTFILIPNNKYTYEIWDNRYLTNETSIWYSENTVIIKQKYTNSWDYCFDRLKQLLNLKNERKKLDYEYS
jgi:hypothetical protein